MDIPRPEHKRRKVLRQVAIAGGVGVLLLLGSVGLAKLEPAAPGVPRASLWIDSVRQGEMLRRLNGPGVLVPKEIRWIAAQTEARVDRIVVRAGAVVGADDVLVEMSNPDLQQQTANALYDLTAAKAALTEARLRLLNEQLEQRAALASARAEFESARLQNEAEKPLAEQGIVPAVTHQRSKFMAEQFQVRRDAVEERLKQFSLSLDSLLEVHRAQVQRMEGVYQRRVEQAESLHVRAGIAGVLQEVLVQEGQRIAVGGNIARVARPDDLRAELQIPQTQAHEVQIGQRSLLDTRNGIIEGRVSRIDPAVQAGIVKVEVDLTGDLPRGARPDLSIDGIIEIERLANVMFTGRPVFGQQNATTSLYKLVDEGRYAIRVPVKIGRTSSDAIEILGGLARGDQVILSDTSAWGDHERIHLTN